MAEAVVVGVRVRPFNEREQNLNATLCIDMQGQTTTITAANGTPQNFNFDQSFWSHDEFEVDANGYSCPIPGGRYSDQRYVYETFGQRVLDNAWAGYHCCLFAYGQTGAGKSYSMVGYGSNKGIVPISCEEIFNRVDSNEDPNKSYEIQLSMIEIYNETVQDLFITYDKRPKNGLTIRESKAMGIYIDGVQKQAVGSYPDIEATIDVGTSNRSVGSTQMNATSSRAHTVITIEFKQVEKSGSQELCKVSNINLVDLAGSEKAGQTGASGDRLKEGSAINKSLSALGNVIEKLAEKSQKGKKDVLVPYRDSKLTRLLQQALGGSSKTIMICALSPASSNYEETLSTLRYADRAKKIKNSAVVNENPQEKLKRELREEILKAMQAEGGSSNPEEVREMQENIENLQKMLTAQQQSFDEKLKESQARLAERNSRKTVALAHTVGRGDPLIMNLNVETQLAGKLRFPFPDGESKVIGSGISDEVKSSESSSKSSKSDDDKSNASSDEDSSDDEDEVDIQLHSPGVRNKHAAIQNIHGKCFLSCLDDEAARVTWVNGFPFKNVPDQGVPEDEIEDVDVPDGCVYLNHTDRLVFGKAIFLFVDPSQCIPEMIIMAGEMTYARARKELPPSWRNTVVGGGGLTKLVKTLTAEAEEEERRELAAEGGGRDMGGKGPSALSERRISTRLGARPPLGSDASQDGEIIGRDRRAPSISSIRSALVEEVEEEESDIESEGEGATQDELLIAELKKEIAFKDRQLEEYRRLVNDLRSDLQERTEEVHEKEEEIERLRQGGAVQSPGGPGSPQQLTSSPRPMPLLNNLGATPALGDTFINALPPRVSSPTNKDMLSSRANFHQKVQVLDASFQEALAALDNTKLGLIKAVSAFDKHSKQLHSVDANYRA